MVTLPRDNPAAPDAPAAATERPSKSQRKRSMHELQDLGEALAALPASRLEGIDMPEALRDAIAEWQRTRSHEGRRRQMQYIGKLMRQHDPQPLREALAREQIGGAREKLALHRVESWRERLMADEAALDALVAEQPAADVATLRRLVQAARAEAAAPGQRHGRSYRELFRFLMKELYPT